MNFFTRLVLHWFGRPTRTSDEAYARFPRAIAGESYPPIKRRVLRDFPARSALGAITAKDIPGIAGNIGSNKCAARWHNRTTLALSGWLRLFGAKVLQRVRAGFL